MRQDAATSRNWQQKAQQSQQASNMKAGKDSGPTDCEKWSRWWQKFTAGEMETKLFAFQPVCRCYQLTLSRFNLHSSVKAAWIELSQKPEKKIKKKSGRALNAVYILLTGLFDLAAKE